MEPGNGDTGDQSIFPSWTIRARSSLSSVPSRMLPGSRLPSTRKFSAIRYEGKKWRRMRRRFFQAAELFVSAGVDHDLLVEAVLQLHVLGLHAALLLRGGIGDRSGQEADAEPDAEAAAEAAAMPATAVPATAVPATAVPAGRGHGRGEHGRPDNRGGNQCNKGLTQLAGIRIEGRHLGSPRFAAGAPIAP